MAWGVMDAAGFGWGRYATKHEAEARRDNLNLITDSTQFVVVKVH